MSLSSPHGNRKDNLTKNMKKLFVARRNYLAHTYSDHGTIFVGTNSEFEQLKDFFRKFQIIAISLRRDCVAHDSRVLLL